MLYSDSFLSQTPAPGLWLRGFFVLLLIPNPSRTNCKESARNLHGIARNLHGITTNLRGIYSFSFLAATFPEKFSPKSLHVSILLPTFAIATIYMWSIPHLCGYAKTEYGGSPSTCFFALCGGSHVCCSRRGSASRFFRTPTSTVPDGFGDKATTYMICKQLHQFSAQLICAR